MTYKKNTLSSDRIQQLNSIGFKWDLHEHAWNEHFDQLCAYKAQNGHCNVPRNDEQNESLGQWVANQRVLYKRNTLNPDCVQQLNSMGFIWDLNELSYEHSWMRMYQERKSFQGKHKHVILPKHETATKPSCEWLKVQRYQYNVYMGMSRVSRIKLDDHFTEECIHLLEKITSFILYGRNY